MKWTDAIFYNFCQGKIEDFYKYLYPDMLVYATSLLVGTDVANAEDWVQDAVEKSLSLFRGIHVCRTVESIYDHLRTQQGNIRDAPQGSKGKLYFPRGV